MATKPVIEFPPRPSKLKLAGNTALANTTLSQVWTTFGQFGPAIKAPRIVFSRFNAANGGSSQIYSMDPVSGTSINVSGSNTWDDTPAISPFNGAIAFSRAPNSGANGYLYIMKTDGSGQTPLVPPDANNPYSFDMQPCWSPEKQGAAPKFIAFQRSFQIWIAHANGSGAIPVMDYSKQPPVIDRSPTFNPTSVGPNYELAFWRQQGGGSFIMKMTITGGVFGAPTNVTPSDPNNFDAWPAWSPLGNYIAFHRLEGTQSAIWIVDPAGVVATNISKPDETKGVQDMMACWKPEGDSIAFSRTSYVSYDIWEMDANGNNQRDVSMGPGSNNDFNPSWQNYTGG